MVRCFCVPVTVLADGDRCLVDKAGVPGRSVRGGWGVLLFFLAHFLLYQLKVSEVKFKVAGDFESLFFFQ